MKHITLLFSILIIAMVANAQKPFQITGHVGKESSPARVYLSYQDSKGTDKLDSCDMLNGAFEFKGTVDGPVKGALLLAHKRLSSIRYFLGTLNDTKNNKEFRNWGNDVLSIYVVPGTTQLSSDDYLLKAKVTGDVLNEELSTFNQEKFPVTSEKMRIMLGINNQASVGTLTRAQRDEALALYQSFVDKEKVLDLNFVKAHPKSIVSLDVISKYIEAASNASELESLFQKLDKSLQTSVYGKKLLQEMANSKALVVGTLAPDFIQNDTAGHPVKLSALRGKYVLLDFWASWCAPCRAENPNIVKAYAEYQNKGFTVLGVSLDHPGAKKDWVNAIKVDGITWTQVSDLKFWDSEVVKLYGIKAVPSNILIDPRGEIVAKNLFGDALNQKLQEIYVKKASK